MINHVEPPVKPRHRIWMYPVKIRHVRRKPTYSPLSGMDRTPLRTHAPAPPVRKNGIDRHRQNPCIEADCLKSGLAGEASDPTAPRRRDRKSTRLNSSH